VTLGDYSNAVMTGDAEAGETDTGITVASVLTAMNEIFQQILRSLLLWLLDEEHKPQHLTRVNEEVDEDEGYDSIASKNTSEAHNSGMKNVIHYLSINFCDLYQLQNKFGKEGKLDKKTLI